MIQAHLFDLFIRSGRVDLISELVADIGDPRGDGGMRFDLRRGSLDVDPDLQDSVKRRLHFVLSRFGFRVRRVTVTLAEAPGDSAASLDTRCRMIVQLAPSGKVRIEVTDTDLENALRRALHRIGPAVDREIVRARETAGRGP
jgi:hypothetical protein